MRKKSKYGRGKHPNCHSPERNKKVRETQIKNKHPWRAVYALTSKGISPDFVQRL